jgi:glycosyltransferase involved in cell wall biosynthesis
LFVGRLHLSKGLDLLCDAFAQVADKHPEVHLAVVGPDFGYRGAFEQRVRQHDLGARVHVLGPVYGQEKISLLTRCEALCLPSRQEGFSVTVLEALACGAPVLISDACNFDEVERAGAGFVTRLDADHVAVALDRLCSDRERRKSMGETARRLVQERYTWTRLASQLVDEYSRHVGQRPQWTGGARQNRPVSPPLQAVHPG